MLIPVSPIPFRVRLLRMRDGYTLCDEAVLAPGVAAAVWAALYRRGLLTEMVAHNQLLVT